MDELVLPPRVRRGDFGGWLQDMMAARGISQRVLAMRTGINHSTISRLVANGRAPTLATAIAIIEVLGTAPVDANESRPSLALVKTEVEDDSEAASIAVVPLPAVHDARLARSDLSRRS
jgi:transcriptional regulator with XRE-family HTH domain